MFYTCVTLQAWNLQCQIFVCYIACIRFMVWSHHSTPLDHQQRRTHTWAQLRGACSHSPNKDLAEVWNDTGQGMKVIIWCDGLKEATPNAQKWKWWTDNSEEDSDDACIRKISSLNKGCPKQGRRRSKKRLISLEKNTEI